MPLVKSGRIVEDRFGRVLDDASIPEGVPVMLPAARFLADARELVLRQAPTGVIWPNDRRIAELVPYLDWIALVALVFPTFRDGRAYSQATTPARAPRVSRRVARNGPGLARSAPVSAPGRLRCLRGEQGEGRRRIRRGAAALQYFLSADGRRTAERAEGAAVPCVIDRSGAAGVGSMTFVFRRSV